MFRKRSESSPDRGGFSGKITLPKGPGETVSQDTDVATGQAEEKKDENEEKKDENKEKKDENKGKVLANAGFSITEPTYDFKHLDSPCTITSRSSLVPVFDEEKVLASDVSGDLSQHTSGHFNTSSMEMGVSECVVKRSSSDVASVGDPNVSVASSSSSRVSPECHRQLRKKRKIFTNEECPVCGVTVRLQDIKEHYSCELKKLDSLKRRLKKPNNDLQLVNKKLEQVKANRVKRSHPHGSKIMKDVAVSTCMVCNPELLDDESAVHARALLHLTECVGVGEDLLEEALQEYSLEDESRRLMGYVDHVDSLSYNRIEHVEDDDSPVNVDSDDDDIAYGSPQFSEQNLILCSSSSASDAGQSNLPESAVSPSDDDAPPPLEMPPASQNGTIVPCDFSNLSEASDMDDSDYRKLQENSQPSLVAQISALRCRIRELEEELQTKSASKCNICLEHYKNPLVSVNCWHVSCEECWIKTLGTKKLCPQCAKITLPTSLRRIYL